MQLFYGTLTVISGKPGSGKSSFLSQLMCESLEQDKPVWMFSREMPCWMEKSWLNHIMAGAHHIKPYEDRNGAKYYKVTPEAKKAINSFYDKKWFLYRDDWSNKFDDIMASMEDSVRKYGAKLLIVDNLMTIDLDQNENSELLKQTECVDRLIKFAMKYSVAVVLVAHPRKLPAGEDVGIYDISGSSNIINLAHRTIGLRRIDQENEKSSHNVCMTLIKDRMRGKAGKKINLYYDVATRRFYTNEAEYSRQYKWDTGKYPPLPYPHAEE
jgi:twinkle protein